MRFEFDDGPPGGVCSALRIADKFADFIASINGMPPPLGHIFILTDQMALPHSYGLDAPPFVCSACVLELPSQASS